MKKTYTVLSPVEHDHERFEVGDTISLEDKVANQLLAVKAIELNLDANLETDTDVRIAEIVAAIGQLDPNNTDQWLGNGKPSIEAVAKVTGWTMTASERDAAYTVFSTPAE